MHANKGLLNDSQLVHNFKKSEKHMHTTVSDIMRGCKKIEF